MLEPWCHRRCVHTCKRSARTHTHTYMHQHVRKLDHTRSRAPCVLLTCKHTYARMRHAHAATPNTPVQCWSPWCRAWRGQPQAARPKARLTTTWSGTPSWDPAAFPGGVIRSPAASRPQVRMHAWCPLQGVCWH